MRAIFLARGPNFEKNKKINSFKNVDVYPLLCEILKITCNPNNGTIEIFAQVFKESLIIDSSTTVSQITSKNLTSAIKPLSKIIISLLVLFVCVYKKI